MVFTDYPSGTVFMLAARGVSLLNGKKTEYREWTLNNIIEEGS